MNIDEVRQEWLQQSEKMIADVMRRYHEQRINSGSGGHEGLGIYGEYQERIAKKKVQIAVKLLERYKFELSTANIHKVTKQNRQLIERYLPSRVLIERETRRIDSVPESQLAPIIPLKRG